MDISNVTEKILRVLLINSIYNDSKRWFAGIRRPSKISMNIMKDLIDLYEKRAKESAKVTV